MTPAYRRDHPTSPPERNPKRSVIALGTEAAMAGFRAPYTLATKLVNELVERTR